MTASHRLVIELDESKDVYRAFFASGDRRALFSTLSYSLSQVDGADDAFDHWRAAIEKVLQTVVAAAAGVTLDQVSLERFNLETFAHLQDEGRSLMR
jgi:hypothetical protein